MSNPGLRRKDTTKGPPLRVLSLDGGGVRGYSMFIILEQIMYSTFVEIEGRGPGEHEIPKPCDHFDLIVGTGTGGLIAIMLGRLRMDIETCKKVYVRMTEVVFQSDKTFVGIPYKRTLFKAGKLEDAIKACVREHTVFEDEGNDVLANAQDIGTPQSPTTQESPSTNLPNNVRRSTSVASRYSQIGISPVNIRASMGTTRWGNPEALLYDTRESRTKTAVTAVFKGTPKNAPAAMLRSYDSRREPAPEFKCKIWEAGRATSAIGLAFKPMQIGQSIFIDEGYGKFNPAPQALDEAVCNEWPGRELGVFISIGTGKRPSGTNAQQHLWWEGFVGGTVGDFAEARRRLVSKIEGCEETHQYMLSEHLKLRNVKSEDYYRMNVEVGVGEFGMNEWNRLAEVSTSTKLYLQKSRVQRKTAEAAAKLGRIHFAKLRYERLSYSRSQRFTNPRHSWESNSNHNSPRNSHSPGPYGHEPYIPPSDPSAVELPGDLGTTLPTQHEKAYDEYYNLHRPSIADQKFAIVPDNDPQAFADDYSGLQTVDPDDPSTQPGYYSHPDRLPYHPQPTDNPKPQPPPRHPSHRYSRNSEVPISAVSNQSMEPGDFNDFVSPTSPGAQQMPLRSSPPPIPPKTPIQKMGSLSLRGYPATGGLPYPVEDGPPPVVNMARKPEFAGR
ncbi:MAG: hypothetical protein M1820_005501 [Bogoriella megaspora]|nr:MAG: hypothetical protein M1820_005501 [Bogoriella megaspora]